MRIDHVKDHRTFHCSGICRYGYLPGVKLPECDGAGPDAGGLASSGSCLDYVPISDVAVVTDLRLDELIASLLARANWIGSGGDGGQLFAVHVATAAACMGASRFGIRTGFGGPWRNSVADVLESRLANDAAGHVGRLCARVHPRVWRVPGSAF